MCVLTSSEKIRVLFCFSQSDDSDIWDDTALIKAYDKAVASFKVKRIMEFHAHYATKEKILKK